VPIFLLIIPVLSTLAGGLLAFRFRNSLSVLTAVGAGLLLGAAFLDLFPEAITLGTGAGVSAANVLGAGLLSFLFFFALDSGLEVLARRWEKPHSPQRLMGRLGGAMLIFHSFRDGMAIGLSYAASHAAGYAVAAGIAAHDLGDGMNTVILTTGGESPRRSDYLFLLADSVAPFLGGVMTVWWTFSVKSSVLLLAIAAGFFIQMATSNFLPQARIDQKSRKLVLPAVIFGTGIIYVANLLLGELR
jgi:zinc transporter ZupT